MVSSSPPGREVERDRAMEVRNADHAGVKRPQGQAADKWARRGAEPALVDVMSDPIVHLLMRRDHLRATDVWLIIEQGRQAVRARRGEAAGAWVCWDNRS